MKGSLLQHGEIGLLASAGLSEVPVFQPPTVGVFSSGDELVNSGSERGPGQIYDSNRPMLLTALKVG